MGNDCVSAQKKTTDLPIDELRHEENPRASNCDDVIDKNRSLRFKTIQNSSLGDLNFKNFY